MENDLEQGEKFFADGKVEEAEVIFLELLAKDPTNPQVLNNLGVLCHAREDIDKAEHYFLKASKAQDDYLEALLNLAGLYQEVERWEDTAALLEKCITLNPREANFHLQLGRVYLEMDYSEKARMTLTRALELDPNQVAVSEILDTLQNKKSASSVSTQTNRRHPTVSIGMPVYNMESTLQEAIDTVLNQTFTDFELIICDNASDDDTEEICRTAESLDSRITYLRCPENIPAECLRRPFLMSTGKYFMWAAADDARKPEMISRCVEALDADLDAALAYTHTELRDPATEETIMEYFDPYKLDQDNPAERYVSLIKNLDLGNAIYGLYRTSVLATIPPLATGSNYCFTDAVFLANIVLQGKVIQIPETLFIRRRGKSSTWLDFISHIERNTNSNYLTKGITLPISESIQEHVRYVMESHLPIETKLQLTQITYETYIERHGTGFHLEIERAVNLAKEGRFTETWNGIPDPHPDARVQEMIDRHYAGILLDRLNRTNRFIQNHQELHLGKAYCLAKIGRKQEAELELEQIDKILAQQSVK